MMDAGQQELERTPLAHNAGQPDRAAVAGQEAELHFRLAELRRIARDPDVARHGQLAAATKREAVDRRDHRLVQALERAEHQLARHVRAPCRPSGPGW